MKEIKFRAWSKKELGYVDALQTIVLWPRTDPNYIYEQYTGLKDVNGEEIYEGDIVKVFHNSIDTVVFRRGCFGLDANYSHPFTPLCALDGSMEIIGNVHENPELLEG